MVAAIILENDQSNLSMSASSRLPENASKQTHNFFSDGPEEKMDDKRFNEEMYEFDKNALYSKAEATAEERKHLHPNFYKKTDKFGVKRTPVSKDDMARVSIVSKIGVTDSGTFCDSSQAVMLQRLVSSARKFAKSPMATITVLNHEKQFSLCSSFDLKAGLTNEFALLQKLTKVEQVSSQGYPIICSNDRAGSVCNYVVMNEGPVIFKDLWEEGDRFKSFRGNKLMIRSYVGVPIRSNGYILGSLCCVDWKVRPDFGVRKIIEQLELMAVLVEGELLSWELQNETFRMKEEERLLKEVMEIKEKKTTPPQARATIVFTGIDGSEALRESNPGTIQAAISLHNKILRTCCSETGGYEDIDETKNVDGVDNILQLAFHEPIDAIAFALKVQLELYQADWSAEVLEQSMAAERPLEKFRGLRVSMGIHHGSVKYELNQDSGNMHYTGEAVALAKSCWGMSKGGQILITNETWKVASFFKTSVWESLGSPQVVHVGEQILNLNDKSWEGIIAKPILQMIPASLAFKYSEVQHEFETGEGRRTSYDTPSGRYYSSPKSQQKMLPSFVDAPRQDGQVSVAVVHASPGLEKVGEQGATRFLDVLEKQIHLSLVQNFGFECWTKEKGVWTLAFHKVDSAVKFSVSLMDLMDIVPGQDSIDRNFLKVGIVTNDYYDMVPHKTTGLVCYTGPVVDQAVFAAEEANPGDVCIGVIGGTTDHLVLDSSIATKKMHTKKSPDGEEMSFFSCEQELDDPLSQPLRRRRMNGLDFSSLRHQMRGGL